MRQKEELEWRKNLPDALEIIGRITLRVLLGRVNGFLLNL